LGRQVFHDCRKDTVFTLNRVPRYRVLVLMEKPPRLYEARDPVLTEVAAQPFQTAHMGPVGVAAPGYLITLTGLC
jgi:hypothetical protein